MVRYIKQRDGYTCAPVAIINCLKWSGLNVGLPDVDQVAKLCRTSVGGGTEYGHMIRTLDACIRVFDLKMGAADVGDIESASHMADLLRTSPAALLTVATSQKEDYVSGAHVMFVERVDADHVNIVNMNRRLSTVISYPTSDICARACRIMSSSKAGTRFPRVVLIRKN